MTDEQPGAMTDEEPDFWWQDVTEAIVADLLISVSVSLDPSTSGSRLVRGVYGHLVAIVSEDEGGIIAYALGEENANRIVDALELRKEQGGG